MVHRGRVNKLKSFAVLKSLLNRALPAVVVSVSFLQDIPIPTLKDIFEAMKGNSHVEYLSIAATRSNDPVAYVSSYFLQLCDLDELVHALHEQYWLDELYLYRCCVRQR